MIRMDGATIRVYGAERTLSPPCKGGAGVMSVGMLQKVYYTRYNVFNLLSNYSVAMDLLFRPASDYCSRDVSGESRKHAWKSTEFFF